MWEIMKALENWQNNNVTPARAPGLIGIHWIETADELTKKVTTIKTKTVTVGVTFATDKFHKTPSIDSRNTLGAMLLFPQGCGGGDCSGPLMEDLY